MNAQTFQMIPISRLVHAPENVRKTNPEISIPALKMSILKEGLLQNLIAYPIEKNKIAVVGGGRRRKALAALVKEKKLPDSFEVPCLVCDRNEAVALSLAENVQREAMHPADEFEAFAVLVEQGKSVEDVAARYGITPAVVTRRMKLAQVAPSIMAAFRADELGLDAVMGFTISEDHREQERVLAHLTEHGRKIDRQSVIRMLTHEKVATDDPRFGYITELAFIAAGGGISRDLFDTEGGGYADDSALLDRLTVEKLATKAPAFLAAGWKWIEAVASHDQAITRGFARIHDRFLPLSAEDATRLADAHQRLEALEEQLGDEADTGPLIEKCRAVEAEIETIEARQWGYDPEEMALAGGWLSVDEDGVCHVLGYVKPEDVAALDALRKARLKAEVNDGEGEGAGDGQDEAPEVDCVSSPAPVSVLSDALLTDLHAARTTALRLELAQRPDIALRVVAHSLAGSLISHQSTAARIAVHQTYIPAISMSHCPSDEALKARIGHWQLRLPGQAAELWGAILALSSEDVLDLIAVCAACSIDATHSKHGDGSFRQRQAHAEQLAATLDLDMTQHWTATAEGFFSRISKSAILDAITEALDAEAAARLHGLKKQVMATQAAQAIAGTGWLPAPLRTQGVTTAAVSAPAEVA